MAFNQRVVEDIWPYCLLLAIQPVGGKGKTYKYEHVGGELAEAYGVDMHGALTSAANQQFPGFKLLAQIDAIIDTPETVTEHGQFINKQDKLVKYRACLLPFGKEDGEVTHVIAGLSWKAF